ncbi:MAG TPA: hypothetical protein PK257_00330 [Candidatus Woesebacteria bacterium]|nr:hypothetical protein [Candidatus Woesebacteria bacterium]
MKKKIILYFIFLLSFLLINKTEVFAWSCCKTNASTGGCGYCVVSGGRDYQTLAQRCGEGAPWCQTATPVCGIGWSPSCVSGDCNSCTLSCNDCDNTTTCYQEKTDCLCNHSEMLKLLTTESYTATGPNCLPKVCPGLKTAQVFSGTTTETNTITQYCFTSTRIKDSTDSTTNTYSSQSECLYWRSQVGSTDIETYTDCVDCSYTIITEATNTPYDPPCYENISPSCSSLPGGCLSGYTGWTDQTGTDGTYNWNCYGSCPGTSTSCSASSNYPPVIDSLIIVNYLGDIVDVESDNRNQICQNEFKGSRKVTFIIMAGDQDGDALNYSLSLGTNVIADKVSTNSITFTFPDDSTWNNSSAQIITATVTDSHGASASNKSRSLKVWDCKVDISGKFYDGSAGLNCPTTGFSTPADKAVLNLTTLAFSKNSVPIDMNVDSDGISYTSGVNALIWGTDGYIPQFNSDIALSDQKMKSQSSSSATMSCDWWIDTTDVDPYTADPSFTADFSGVANKDPWWQTKFGGVVSNNRVINRVPNTCSDCKMSPSGLVSAPNITNSGLSLSNAQPWYYKSTAAKLSVNNTDYSYFLTQYHDKNNIGVVLSGNKSIADVGTNGIYFVDGNLTIDNNLVKTGNFLMIIVKGDISVTENVTRVDGILVANNIIAAGINSSPLNFNGSLYAADSTNLSGRSLGGSANNSSPAVIVKYDPEMIFNIPESLAKVLTSWQWGN